MRGYKLLNNESIIPLVIHHGDIENLLSSDNQLRLCNICVAFLFYEQLLAPEVPEILNVSSLSTAKSWIRSIYKTPLHLK
jgi:hypothetical protein